MKVSLRNSIERSFSILEAHLIDELRSDFDEDF